MNSALQLFTEQLPNRNLRRTTVLTTPYLNLSRAADAKTTSNAGHCRLQEKFLPVREEAAAAAIAFIRYRLLQHLSDAMVFLWHHPRLVTTTSTTSAASTAS